MVRNPASVGDRFHAWIDQCHADDRALRGDVSEACAALVRMATTVPRGLPPSQRDTVCRVLGDAWAHVLAAVDRACDGSRGGAGDERPLPRVAGDRRAAQLLADIDRRYADPHLTLTTVASELAVSPSHLTQILKAATGRTFGAHLHVRRVSEARRLLVVTRLSVKEVASHVGYATTTQLDRHFRKVVGCPPTAYRESQWRSRTAPVRRASCEPLPTQSPTHPQK